MDTSWTSGDWTLSIRPDMGGALTACRYRGRNVLRPAVEGGGVLGASAFPMVPFVGRIDRGRFEYDGAAYAVPPNFPPEPHAIHGHGWQSAWSHGVIHDALRLELKGADPRWPWPVEASQTFVSDGNLLLYELRLTNLGDTAMPAGLGWHPYFEAEGASVTANVSAAWAGARAHDRVELGEAERLTEPTPVSGLDVDRCFEWPGGQAAIRLGNGLSIEMEAGPFARRLTLYHPAGAEFFCVEPVTQAPDAVNMPDPGPAGLQRLAPGGTLVLTALLRVRD